MVRINVNMEGMNDLKNKIKHLSRDIHTLEDDINSSLGHLNVADSNQYYLLEDIKLACQKASKLARRADQMGKIIDKAIISYLETEKRLKRNHKRTFGFLEGVLVGFRGLTSKSHKDVTWKGFKIIAAYSKMGSIFNNRPKVIKKTDLKPLSDLSKKNVKVLSKPQIKLPVDMHVSDKLVSFIAAYEGFSSKPYRGQDKNNLTIGYGHVIRKGENFSHGISKAEALKLLKKDINKRFAKPLNEWAEKHGIKLNQNQFDALVSFIYNVGFNGFLNSSLAKDILKGNTKSDIIKKDFLKWVKVKNPKTKKYIISKGLQRRRLDEWELFTKGNYKRDNLLVRKKVKKTSGKKSYKLRKNKIPTYHSVISYNPNKYNKDVVAIQKKLNKLGYHGKDGKPLVLDGYLGKNTLYAINLFKKDHKLSNKGKSYGKVNKKTWTTLFLTTTKNNHPIKKPTKVKTPSKSKVKYVKVKFGGKSISLHSSNILKDILKEAGEKKVTITSTVRSPHDQARVMYENLVKSKDPGSSYRLYNRYGDKVIDVYVKLKGTKSKSEIIEAMEKKIIELGPSKVSKHCGDAKKLEVIDIAPSSVANKSAFIKAVNEAMAEGKITKFIQPPKDPAYHIEIPQ